MVFWLADSNNYYGVYIAPNGSAAINRVQNERFVAGGLAQSHFPEDRRQCGQHDSPDAERQLDLLLFQ